MILPFIIVILALPLIFQCNVKKENNNISAKDINDIVAAYFAAVRAMDMEAWIATFADNAVSYDPVGAPPYKGHKRLRQLFQAINETFAEIEIREDNVFIAGNRAAVKWTCQGVGKNDRQVSFEGIDVFEINKDGKIQTIWAYWDPSVMLSALR